jgi:hypothetical protein
MTNINLELANIDLDDNIKVILNEKFSIISEELKKIMHPAIKGNRKGFLTFNTDAAKCIYSINDKFAQYIVRAIYDNFNDSKNGTFYIHCNELFNNDFVKVIFRKMNPDIDKLELTREIMRSEHLNNQELSTINNTIHKKYELFLSERRPFNVFNVNNEASKPFYLKYNEMKNNVLKIHPRVRELAKYIENDYTLRQERTKLEKEHASSFPEYNKLESRKTEIYDIQRTNENTLDSKLKEEYAKMDFSKINKSMQKMVDQFVIIVVNTLINQKIA